MIYLTVTGMFMLITIPKIASNCCNKDYLNTDIDCNTDHCCYNWQQSTDKTNVNDVFGSKPNNKSAKTDTTRHDHENVPHEIFSQNEDVNPCTNKLYWKRARITIRQASRAERKCNH